MNQKLTLILAGTLGFLGVALGAFGAHALKPFLIETGRVDTFELAVRYQFYHALALLLIGVLQQSFTNTLLKRAALSMFSGVIVFSSSLFLLCFTGLSTIAVITPFGGVLLLVGWFLLIAGVLKK